MGVADGRYGGGMRHEQLVSAFLACACVLVACVTPAGAESIFPRVRPLDAPSAGALSRGRRDSPTLAALLDALERSDVIVHLETRWFRCSGVLAKTRFIARAGGQRYLRISVDARQPEEAAVALLGHELQHAREIAQARWVADQDGLAELYRRIGHRTGREDAGLLRVDTRAGPDVQRQVFAELREAQRRRDAEHLSGAD
jgi:hypothetical protein